MLPEDACAVQSLMFLASLGMPTLFDIIVPIDVMPFGKSHLDVDTKVYSWSTEMFCPFNETCASVLKTKDLT